MFCFLTTFQEKGWEQESQSVVASAEGMLSSCIFTFIPLVHLSSIFFLPIDIFCYVTFIAFIESHREQHFSFMKSFLSVSAGGCWRGVEICTSQVVALLLRWGPNPPRPVQPGSQPKVVLLPGAPHQILSDTNLQSQKPPPHQWAGTGNAKIPNQGKTLSLGLIESSGVWTEFGYIFLVILLSRSLTFIYYWQLAVFRLLEQTHRFPKHLELDPFCFCIVSYFFPQWST